jgi:hypothetical protein
VSGHKVNVVYGILHGNIYVLHHLKRSSIFATCREIAEWLWTDRDTDFYRQMNFVELIKGNGASMTDSALEQRARRMARKQEKFITKVDPRSRWYNQYGPYMVSDLYTNTVEAYGINSAEELVNYFAEEEDTFRRIRKGAEMTRAEKEVFAPAASIGQGINKA